VHRRVIAVAIGFVLFVIACAKAYGNSICYGNSARGSLENGEQLPFQGENFSGYSRIGHLLGRTYVHSEVKSIVLDAYSALALSDPEKRWMYAETGFQDGGRFKPHKTHQHGLSVDFMVPVLDENDRSSYLPITLLNNLGYGIEFDGSGRYGEYRIDYEAMAAHLNALHQSALKQGYDLDRVIFDLDLQKQLFATKLGARLQHKLRFSLKPAWVRHDEHYHVDFDIPCVN
jgi:penicillin-insensitive murein endopeptidase